MAKTKRLRGVDCSLYCDFEVARMDQVGADDALDLRLKTDLFGQFPERAVLRGFSRLQKTGRKAPGVQMTIDMALDEDPSVGCQEHPRCADAKGGIDAA